MRLSANWISGSETNTLLTLCSAAPPLNGKLLLLREFERLTLSLCLFHFAVESSWKHALPAAALFSSNSGKKWLRLRPPPLSLYCLLATKLFRFMLANKFVNHPGPQRPCRQPTSSCFPAKFLSCDCRFWVWQTPGSQRGRMNQGLRARIRA